MTGELDRSQTSTLHVRLLKQPPNNAEDIKVSPHAICIIGEVAHLDLDECAILARWLPTMLLHYSNEAHPASAVPTEKQAETVFKTISRFQDDASTLLSTAWIKRALIGQRHQRLLKRLKSPTSEQNDTSVFQARHEVEALFDGVGQLVEDLSLLPSDPLLKAVIEEKSRTARSENAALMRLSDWIQIVWTRHLRRSRKISPHQPERRESARPHCPIRLARPCRRGDRMSHRCIRSHIAEWPFLPFRDRAVIR